MNKYEREDYETAKAVLMFWGIVIVAIVLTGIGIFLAW